MSNDQIRHLIYSIQSLDRATHSPVATMLLESNAFLLDAKDSMLTYEESERNLVQLCEVVKVE